jgi:hypothetical protein
MQFRNPRNSTIFRKMAKSIRRGIFPLGQISGIDPFLTYPYYLNPNNPARIRGYRINGISKKKEDVLG